MLTVTPQAATLVRRLRTDAGLPDDAGLRISIDPLYRSLHMSWAAHPSAQDVVLSHEGALLFLAPRSEVALRRGNLHAERSVFVLDRDRPLGRLPALLGALRV